MAGAAAGSAGSGRDHRARRLGQGTAVFSCCRGWGRATPCTWTGLTARPPRSGSPARSGWRRAPTGNHVQARPAPRPVRPCHGHRASFAHLFDPVMAARIVHPTYALVLTAWTGQDEVPSGPSWVPPSPGAGRLLPQVARAARTTSKGDPPRARGTRGRVAAVGTYPRERSRNARSRSAPRVEAGSERTVCPKRDGCKPRLIPGLGSRAST